MKIDTQLVRTVPAGEAFIYEGTVYIRTDSNEYTAVSLEDGSLEQISEGTSVMPLFGAHVWLS